MVEEYIGQLPQQKWIPSNCNEGKRLHGLESDIKDEKCGNKITTDHRWD